MCYSENLKTSLLVMRTQNSSAGKVIFVETLIKKKISTSFKYTAKKTNVFNMQKYNVSLKKNIK